MAGRGILLLIVFVALTKPGLSEEVDTLPGTDFSDEFFVRQSDAHRL